jgi:hypothetical protein
VNVNRCQHVEWVKRSSYAMAGRTPPITSTVAEILDAWMTMRPEQIAGSASDEDIWALARFAAIIA